MASLPFGPFSVGPADGTLRLHVFKDGIAARLGHDLDLVVRSWSAEGVVADPIGSSTVRLVADLRTVEVEAGHGGAKPLSDSDRKQILGSLEKSLGVDRHPEVIVVGDAVSGGGDAFELAATATVAGQAAPVRVEIVVADGAVRLRSTIVQTAHGVKPFRAPLGALKIKDAVGVTLEVRVP